MAALIQWLIYRPADLTGNLTASWHVSNDTFFSPDQVAMCWDTGGKTGAEHNPGVVALQAPVIAGEIGERDCTHTFIDPLLSWLDQHGVSYLGWEWNTYGCKDGPSLISDYNGTPTQTFGQGYKDHLAALAAQAAPLPTGIALCTTANCAGFNPPIAPAAVNGAVKVGVQALAPATGLSGWNLDVTYNPTLLRFVACDSAIGNCMLQAGAPIVHIGGSASTALAGAVTLASLHFYIDCRRALRRVRCSPPGGGAGGKPDNYIGRLHGWRR